ncbi:MAG: hypothetical protein C0428_13085 [Polaromonas sp.]|uniref:hypothetical protein n=1 Tax=Polaromonas sp. TaxID=1869339 RepID=UPI004037055D|nr:hypothetical protein [Polaromonas sp.]
MTSATFFPGSTPSSSTGKRSAPAAALVNKAVAGAQAAFKAPRAVISAVAAYPWMTQAMLAGMSPRARRLLRADY